MVSELVNQRAYATEAGTRRFVERHSQGRPDDAFSHVGMLHLSSLGLGTYLGPATDEGDVSYIEAVVEAVRQGINVIDTAANYRHQRSERAVGVAIGQLIAMGEVYRSELLVASKAGFVAFDGVVPGDRAQHCVEVTVGHGLAAPDELMARCHCIAPDFIAASLDRSLVNLGLETVDVYFLHNPETQLHELTADVFYERLRRAFARLEQAADEGKVRVYGIATWSGLRARPDERDHVSLERVLACAEEVAGSRHRCRAIQLPLNVLMPEAATFRCQSVKGQWLTPLEAAAELGLVAFTSGTLHQGRLATNGTSDALPLIPDAAGGPERLLTADDALQFARSVDGVTTALVGMADIEHVRANVASLKAGRPTRSWVEALLQRFATPARGLGG